MGEKVITPKNLEDVFHFFFFVFDETKNNNQKENIFSLRKKKIL
jgi:hypothetical protein